MTPGDRGALEALNARIDHTAATARLLAQAVGGDVDADVTDTIVGIACTLTEVAARVDSILNPRGVA